MEKENEDKIKKLITTAYFICKHEKPFTDFPRLVDLQEVNGLDMGNFYRSDNACRRFIQFIYEDLFKGVNILTENDLHFYSILIDGATDSSVTENELIYLRFVENGKPVNHYFSIEDVEKADAQGILKEIEGAFTRNGIPNWKDKLIGFGSDGASVNLGCRGGIATLIKRDVPHLVITHCIAHRLELAANSAIKNHKHMKEIQDLLQYLYKHYQYSPKALRELKQIGEALEEKVLKPTKFAGTRWLPHIHRALEVLVREFRVLPAHFEHIRESKSGSAEVQVNGHKIETNWPHMGRKRWLVILDAIMDHIGEWKDFKAYVGRHKAIVSVENIFIHPDLKRRFENLILVLELLLSFPLSSAVCERGFSAMKRVKTDWRSSLKPEMLLMLLFITVEGPEFNQFDTNSVFNHWWSSGRQKRPGYNPNEFRLRGLPDPDMAQSDDDIDDN
ncbi:unnamed protein product [Mytilus coruscus]|uniref:HAT C-terminal dimerisation domain-containing protein n=1 Tax=Mytilus coruscus TaxID=42192 RepID=A0A6J8B754_MYTCO|nr:unnamed protein product [Mytilus coruscus]